MNELSFEGWKFFLKNALYYPSAWYFIYWAVPLLILLALIVYHRKHLSGEKDIWKRVGHSWKKTGLVLCGVVLVMYALTVYSVPKLVFTPLGITVPMLAVYQQRLAGTQEPSQQGEDAVIANLEKQYVVAGVSSTGDPNPIILFFFEEYPYLHSVLFTLLYLSVFAWVFVVKGRRIERERWSLSSVSK
jgi:hypothetical protein